MALASPALRDEAARAADDHAIPHLRAAFAMAPALIQALNPASLHQIHIPVRIILGDADQVAPPATNGLQAATAIPGAALTTLPGVGHYDFLATCTDFGRAAVPVCHTHMPQPATHQAAIDAATAFFKAKM